MKQVTAIVVGAGIRGFSHARYAIDFPDEFKIVGVASPTQSHREKFQKAHDIPDDKATSDWSEMAKREKFADCVLICTLDRLHKEPAVAFAKKGYHIFLEKPMAVTYSDCQEIVDTCEENGVILSVCHGLRYSAEARKIKEIIESGLLGDVINIQLMEPVGFYHFAHGFVRGLYNNADTTAFSLLTKSCHDLDLITYWMGQKQCTKISSFGSLKHFTKENKPDGASSRCLDCKVEKECPYSAKKIYLDYPIVDGCTRGLPLHALTDVPDIENLTEALKTGPYGRCVYDCDNNVMDNQVVNLQYAGGETAQFTMVAFTELLCQRQVRIFGTLGEISCDFSQPKVRLFEFLEEKTTVFDLNEEVGRAMATKLKGHGGSDFFVMESFVHAVATGDTSKVLTGPEETLRSHRLCFMAEQSRVENKTINL